MTLNLYKFASDNPEKPYFLATSSKPAEAWYFEDGHKKLHRTTPAWFLSGREARGAAKLMGFSVMPKTGSIRLDKGANA